jgi:uncharacterized membrane protein YkvA (DUF1232 family)
VFLATMPAKPTRASSRSRPTLTAADFERHLVAHAATIAPSDVTALLGRSDALRQRLTGERAVHPALAQRARVALWLLTDHGRGACPQIPYQTVSLLATALLYYLAPMDVIPDFIPRAGTADDALVLDIAWRLAAPGVQRYIDWKGLPPGDAEPESAAMRLPPARPGRHTPPRAAPPKVARAATARPREVKSRGTKKTPTRRR